MSPQSYIPDALPLSNLDYRPLLPLVDQASAALARCDALNFFVESIFCFRLHKSICRVYGLRNERLP